MITYDNYVPYITAIRTTIIPFWEIASGYLIRTNIYYIYIYIYIYIRYIFLEKINNNIFIYIHIYIFVLI